MNQPARDFADLSFRLMWVVGFSMNGLFKHHDAAVQWSPTTHGSLTEGLHALAAGPSVP